VVTRMKKKDVISNGHISPGDVIVGLSSCGQTSYETEYNSGIGSNGLTSARHDIFNKIYAEKYPESFDPGLQADLVYSGGYRLTDQPEGLPLNMGKLVLSPTRTYAPLFIPLLKKLKSNIHGIIHCSGGAQTKILHFMNENQIIKDNLFPVPPLFKIIQEESRTDWKEMYQVFNMGHRMEIYLPENAASTVIRMAEEFNIEARIVGKVMPSSRPILTIKSEHGIFEYQKE